MFQVFGLRVENGRRMEVRRCSQPSRKKVQGGSHGEPELGEQPLGWRRGGTERPWGSRTYQTLPKSRLRQIREGQETDVGVRPACGGSNRIQQRIAQSTRHGEGKHCLVLHLLFPVRGECGGGKGQALWSRGMGVRSQLSHLSATRCWEVTQLPGPRFPHPHSREGTAPHGAVRSPAEVNIPATLTAGPARVSGMGGPL